MKKKKTVYFSLVILLSLTAIYTLYMSINNYLTIKNIKEEVYLVSASNISFEKTTKEIINQYKKIYNNDDIVAILNIESLDINTFLVQTDNNKYYLNHLINKKHNKTGAVFIDYRTDINTSKQLNIYGHSSGSYDIPFNYLRKYLDKEFFLNNQELIIKTEDNTYIYDIFSVKITNNEEHLNVIYESDKEFLQHVKLLRKDSLYDTNVEVLASDHILTLQTCIFNNPKGSLLIINFKRRV